MLERLYDVSQGLRLFFALSVSEIRLSLHCYPATGLTHRKMWAADTVVALEKHNYNKKLIV